MSDTNYYAFLGHMPVLSLLELQALGLNATELAPNIVKVTTDPLPVSTLLGGTVKLAIELEKVGKREVIPRLSQLIEAGKSKNQAVTDYANLELSKTDLYRLKTSVTRPIRLVSLDTSPHETVMLIKQNVTEYNLIKSKDEVIIACSIWFQNGIDWANRDRLRPYQDIKRGMLPPKLARIMINLASRNTQGILYDPFCGTGTILMEAALLGHQIIGSDKDDQAVLGARANLDWLIDQYSLSGSSYKLFAGDATHISTQIKKVNYIVTEPYMGPLLDKRVDLNLSEVKNIAKGLDKLYRGALREWNKVLSREGRVVMIIPSFLVGKDKISSIKIDTCQALGYNMIASVPYSKPGATVIRNVTILEKQ